KKKVIIFAFTLGISVCITNAQNEELRRKQLLESSGGVTTPDSTLLKKELERYRDTDSSNWKRRADLAEKIAGFYETDFSNPISALAFYQEAREAYRNSGNTEKVKSILLSEAALYEIIRKENLPIDQLLKEEAKTEDVFFRVTEV